MIESSIEEFYITIKNYEIHVIQEVKNPAFPTLIFLHDALGSVETWRTFPFDLVKQLAYNVLVYSRRGHGKSAPLDDIKGLDFFEIETEELRSIIEYFSLKKNILIGSSDGGTIALNYASKYDTLGLVTIAGHYMNESATFEGVLASRKEPFNSQLRKALEKYHDKKAERLVESWQNNWTDATFQSWTIQEEIANISCPVLIIQGKNDEYATDLHAKSLGEIIEDSEVHLIENVGHFPHKENSIFTSELILRFLQKIKQV